MQSNLMFHGKPQQNLNSVTLYNHTQKRSDFTNVSDAKHMCLIKADILELNSLRVSLSCQDAINGVSLCYAI